MKIIPILIITVARFTIVWLFFVGFAWLIQDLINSIFSISLNENIWIIGALLGLIWFWKFGEGDSVSKGVKKTLNIN